MELETYLNANVICKKDGYILTYPKNCWDMNYHLINTLDGKDYLIDIDDIADNFEDIEDYGMLWDEFRTLYDIDSIMGYVWKIA